MFVEIGTAAGYFGRTFKNSSGAGLSNGSSVANLLHPSTTPQTVSFGYTSVSGGELRVYWNGNYVNSSSVTSYVPTTLTNMRIGRGWVELIQLMLISENYHTTPRDSLMLNYRVSPSNK